MIECLYYSQHLGLKFKFNKANEINSKTSSVVILENTSHLKNDEIKTKYERNILYYDISLGKIKLIRLYTLIYLIFLSRS